MSLQSVCQVLIHMVTECAGMVSVDPTWKWESKAQIPLHTAECYAGIRPHLSLRFWKATMLPSPLTHASQLEILISSKTWETWKLALRGVVLFKLGQRFRASRGGTLTASPAGARHWRCCEGCWRLFPEEPSSHLLSRRSASRSWGSAPGTGPEAREAPCWHSSAICCYFGRETWIRRKPLRSFCTPSPAGGRFQSNSCSGVGTDRRQINI